MRVARRQGVLEGGRGTAPGRRSEELLDRLSSMEWSSAADDDRLSIVRAAAPWAARLIFSSALVPLLAGGRCAARAARPSRACSPRRRRRRATGSPHRLATALARPARRPRAARRRSRSTSQTGEVVFARNRSLVPRCPRRTRSSRSRTRRWPGSGPAYRFRTEVLGLGHARRSGADVARRPRAEGLRRPDARPRRPAGARAAAPRAGASGASPGAVLGDESAYDDAAHRARAGSRRSSSTSARRSRRSIVDRGWLGWSTSRAIPRSTAARLPRRARRARASHVGKRSRGCSRRRRRPFPLALDVSEPLADIVRVMGTRQRQLPRRDAAQAARRGAAAAPAPRRRERAVVDGHAARGAACRSRACASPTAPASRASTG